ncbi:MAG: hypothetical protein ABFS23_09970 [Pseudomonadota bacterium]
MPTQQITQDDKQIPTIQRIVAILWPSFLTAIPATGLFFSLFDPVELGEIAGFGEITRLGGYTLGFFSFWIVTAVSGAISVYFARPCGPARPKTTE